jgi:hypothetical protein
MKKKICSKCREEKDICEFNKETKGKDGLYSSCKVCHKRRVISYIKYNPDNNKKWKQKSDKNFKLKNPNYQKEWIANNPEYHKNYNKNKREDNPVVKLSSNIRGRIRYYLKLKNIDKNQSTFEIVGCEPQKLKIYIENLFTDNMSWNNYGMFGWHIDHIIPLSSAKTEKRVYELCHYTNLQPLWAEENLKKGSKI